ncbi:SpoIIE family protein phosphatase [Nocardioides sp. TRM66260-LWL]|uniref:SpoIIE family protein phosphatase n=1 Tax=Nocardioides sp. TRM66260-LWL TaxID=2874478 RepID=UPI001CC72BF6|nr:SpoIIE family protein phosphatase [Nocardioides sp. TRM66260-LWL]MBZ5735472.1 SpoIIE family protein phosphatase [Nocardioides sp. TRM66260-LWL]
MTQVEPAAHSPAHPPFDLDTCEREPIHVPGAIQPHGVLLAVRESDGQIVMTSANVLELLGVPPEKALRLRLADLVGDDLGSRVVEHADAVRGEPVSLVLPSVRADADDAGSLRGRAVEAVVHRSGLRIVVELEEVDGDQTMLSYQSARSAMARLVDARSVTQLADRLAQEIRDVTGFDRVMVYRFDADWNGEVIAEQRRDDLNPFLGLHYPATDIPAQARRLYTVNWIRLIADVSYRPVPCVPVLDPGTGAPLDLSFSTLRSVSPIHVEYLTNMGVTSSMSVSLIVDGELWGLIACHHYSGPHRPSHEARAAAEFLGQIASQMMAERERSDVREQELRSQSLYAELTAAMIGAGDRMLEVLAAHPNTLEIADADGVALFYNGRVITGGRTPPDDVCRRIAALLRRADGEPASTHHLAGLDPALEEHADTAAGALIVGTAGDRWLAFYRPEMPRVVDWGGDPANAKLYEREGDHVRLSPRKSFDQWREIVRHHSRPWTQAQHDLANGIRAHAAGLLLHRSREQIAVTEALQRTVVTDLVTDVGGLQIASRYRPASEVRLGGDWWDHLEFPDGRVAFTLGDVAGHGVAAVAAMTQIRTALRSYLYAGAEPSLCLDLLDQMMVGLLEDQVASALLLVIDPGTGEVEMINAGHPAPMIFGDGPARPLEGISRPLLGVGAGTARTFSATLPPGATLLAYTDGLHERRDRDLAATVEELRASAEPGPVDGVGPWVARLVDDASAGGDDDTTVLAIHRPIDRSSNG